MDATHLCSPIVLVFHLADFVVVDCWYGIFRGAKVDQRTNDCQHTNMRYTNGMLRDMYAGMSVCMYV